MKALGCIFLFSLLTTNAHASSADCLASYVAGDYVAAAKKCSKKWFNTLDKQVGYYVYAEMFELGRGVETDLDHALSLYAKSADAGYPLAFVRLGNHYSDIDKCESLAYFIRAASTEWEGRSYSEKRVKLLREERACSLTDANDKMPEEYSGSE